MPLGIGSMPESMAYLVERGAIPPKGSLARAPGRDARHRHGRHLAGAHLRATEYGGCVTDNTFPEHAILEVAHLDVKSGQTEAFESAFAEAQRIISGMAGYRWHQLQRCVEDDHRYVLLVSWERLEDHTEGFRGSPEYQDWKRLLHHFYDPFPTVEHYRLSRIDHDGR